MTPRDIDRNHQPTGGISPHSFAGRLALLPLDRRVGGVQIGKALAARNPPILQSRALETFFAG